MQQLHSSNLVLTTLKLQEISPPSSTTMDSIKAQEPLLSEKESHDQPNTAQHISTPSPEASPEQIRTYLSHLLITKRKLPEDYVRPIVANWKLGSGQELRSYSPAMYLRIFGHEDGWIIYREVELAKLHEDARAKTTLQRNWICESLHFIPMPSHSRPQLSRTLPT
jgi:hypothetical protein